MAAQWETRFTDLLADHPDAEGELARLEELRAGAAVDAADHSVAVGGDLSITAEGGSAAAAVIHGNVRVGPTSPGRAAS